MVCIYHSVLAQSGWKTQAITGHTNTVVAHQPLVIQDLSPVDILPMRIV